MTLEGGGVFKVNRIFEQFSNCFNCFGRRREFPQVNWGHEIREFSRAKPRVTSNQGTRASRGSAYRPGEGTPRRPPATCKVSARSPLPLLNSRASSVTVSPSLSHWQAPPAAVMPQLDGLQVSLASSCRPQGLRCCSLAH
eukprot:1554277-Rhodomonas_salina.1